MDERGVTLGPLSWVEVHIPNSPHPPARVTLATVRADLASGRLPENALVRTSQDGVWAAAATVVTACPAFQPTRAGGAIALLMLAPLGLLGLHATAFGTTGIWGPALLVLGGAVAAITIGIFHSLRTRRTGDVLKIRGVLVPSAVLLVAAVVPGAVVGMKGRLAHGAIRTAAAATDPCAMSGVKRELESFGDEEEQRLAADQAARCDAKRLEDYCTIVGKQLSDGSYIPKENRFSSFVDANPTAEGSAAIAERVATNKLVADDFKLTPSSVVCGAALWPALVATLARSPAAWNGDVPTMSAELTTALAAHGISPEVVATLVARAEAAAKQPPGKSTDEYMARAHRACSALISLKVQAGAACTAFEKRYDSLLARRATEEKAKDERCGRVQEALNRCLDPCMDLDLFDPRADACEARCRAAHPTRGCE